MKTLYHPNLTDTSIEVEDSAVDAFTAQGWRKTPRPKSKDAPASGSTTSSSASGEDKTKEVTE